MLYKALYRRFDAVVCQSKEMHREMLDFYDVPEDKALIINNPVDVKTVQRLAEAQSTPDTAASFRIVTAGRLARQKGFDLLLQALAKLEKGSFHMRILGQGPEEAALKQQAKELGLSECVEWAGFIENPYTTMASADLYLMSSRYEGFPNAVLEAGALGVPVVAFNCIQDMSEIIVEGVTGLLVPPEDTDALAAAIQKAADHDWDKAAISQSIEERYGVEKIKSAYEDLFLSAVKRKTKHGG
jgi:glycosyltransferase involved in cell wall biosynthesis